MKRVAWSRENSAESSPKQTAAGPPDYLAVKALPFRWLYLAPLIDCQTHATFEHVYLGIPQYYIPPLRH